MEKNILDIDPCLIPAYPLIRFSKQCYCILWLHALNGGLNNAYVYFEILVKLSTWDLHALEIHAHSHIAKFLKNYIFKKVDCTSEHIRGEYINLS